MDCLVKKEYHNVALYMEVLGPDLLSGVAK